MKLLSIASMLSSRWMLSTPWMRSIPYMRSNRLALSIEYMVPRVAIRGTKKRQTTTLSPWIRALKRLREAGAVGIQT